MGITNQELLDLYKTMVTAREADLIEQEFTGRGEAFFHVSGAGHEASATLNNFLGPEDWLHCHYRDKALMMARGITPKMFFYSLFNKKGSHSAGRQMNAHMSAPELNIMSLVGPVGNNGLHAVGVAETVKNQSANPVVLCSLGDGMTQQGEILEAVAHAVREQLPVLFLVQDNKYAISTTTEGKTFYDRPQGIAKEFYGVPVTVVNGKDPLETSDVFQKIVNQMREDRKPAIVVMKVERLDNHTNADDQRTYRTSESIEEARKTADPILNLREVLIKGGETEENLSQIREQIITDLRKDAWEAQRSEEPEPNFDAKKPLDPKLSDPAQEYRGTPSQDTKENLSMIEAIKAVLRSKLESDDRVHLFGEDIEDPKGDVFGLTKGLSTSYPGRVVNSPLAEASILGLSIGYALAGKRPVAFLQFADFLPIAYNQIVSELGSMYWRTEGGWEVPVIVMITCGGYRPGLGPFHASSYEALAVHTPGVDVMMPSSAGDAAGLLNSAFESGRPTLFFYPKNCLNDRARMTSTDIPEHMVPLGVARTIREGKDITMVGYGNTIPLIEQAAGALEKAGAGAEVIDLRTLSPWDSKKVIQSVQKTGRLVVAHEDNESAGMGSEVIAQVSEALQEGFQAKRVTRADTYVPCNFGNQLEVLPSYKRILEESVSLMGGAITWKKDVKEEKGFYFVEAVGSSPSDEEVTVIKWEIAQGDTIKEGDTIAELEADKAAFELKSPVAGEVDSFIIEEGFSAKVGDFLLKVKTGESEVNLKPITREDNGVPTITGLKLDSSASEDKITLENTIGIVDVVGKKGSRTVSNEEIAQLCKGWEAEEIKKRIGIESRPWIQGEENALSLATEAAWDLLERNGLDFTDIDTIIMATGTPIFTSPSMAAMLQDELNKRAKTEHTVPAYDFSAACSGYVYGLSQAYDHLAQKPRDRVLLVTTEVLSPKINFDDPGTAPIFADGATASLLVGTGRKALIKAELDRPVLGAHGGEGESLCVPVSDSEFITMDGPKVYLYAVKYMMKMIEESCELSGLAPEDLDLVVPHQANQRITNAIRQRMKLPKEKVYSNIAYNGNTSSSTIPLCLEEVLPGAKKGENLGLVAFGGGFTFGGAILKIRK